MESKCELLKIWELIIDIPDHCVIFHDDQELKVISAYITTKYLHNSLHSEYSGMRVAILSLGPLEDLSVINRTKFSQHQFNEIFRPRKEYRGYVTGIQYGI